MTLSRIRDRKNPLSADQKRVAFLTLLGQASDAVYRLTDHIAFLERIKFLNLSAETADKLDRFIEVFW
jgi:hypothetical protein